jgi:type I site-specific restriction-modification system R (restriction) subunit
MYRRFLAKQQHLRAAKNRHQQIKNFKQIFKVLQGIIGVNFISKRSLAMGKKRNNPKKNRRSNGENPGERSSNSESNSLCRIILKKTALLKLHPSISMHS